VRERAPIVLKIGSSSLTHGSGRLSPEAVERVVGEVASLWALGHPTVLVSSGAVAAGLPVLGVDQRPRDIPGLQVAAAVGQGKLMEVYSTAFNARGLQVGQVLLTRDVLSRREQYLNAREALERMLSLGVVPIVNENDTVVVDELRLGDNDRLAAIVSHMVRAGMLILLTDTPGLYSDDPWISDEAEFLEAVRHTDKVLDDLLAAARPGGAFGSGGVATKVAAARMAAWSGIPTVIASASEKDVAVRAVRGESPGTWVEPHESRLSARKLWIAFGLPSRGTISVDAGAAAALTDLGRSLLAVGVIGVRGDFEKGAPVEIESADRMIGKGLARVPAVELDEIMGRHSSESGGVVVHRDDMVVLA
jgi:glutamate 5-kinase